MKSERQFPGSRFSLLVRIGLVLALTGVLAQCTDRAREITAPSEPPVRSEVRVEAAPERLAMPLSEGCYGEGEKLASGALWRICLPPWWNGSMLVYAPGYMSIYEELRIRDDEIPGTSVQELAMSLGFVYVTTSYHKGGLVLPQATHDLATLVEMANGITERLTGHTSRYVYLAGPSQGGLVTAKSVEVAPQVFSGGLAVCGPYGRFRSQVDYIADFRVVFDYLFAGRIPEWPVWRQNIGAGDPGWVDEDFVAAWHTTFEPRVHAAVLADPGRTAQLLRVTGAPIDPGDPARSTVQTVTGVLWYHIFGSNDAIEVLGGQAFNNRSRFYLGSSNDFLLNLRVQRFVNTGDALNTIASFYETSGRLANPVVTLHTTGDEIVPYWHQLFYTAKVSPWYRHVPIPVARYGHCNFTRDEVLAAFAILVLQVSGQNLAVPASLLPEPEAQARFLKLAREHGAAPTVAREEGR
jgi:hypothetical protein